MKALFYALFLLVVLAGSVVLLRSIEPRREPSAVVGEPVVRSTPPPAATMDDVPTPGASAADATHDGREGFLTSPGRGVENLHRLGQGPLPKGLILKRDIGREKG